MKTRALLIATAVLLGLAPTSSATEANAPNLPGYGWWTGQMIMNIDQYSVNTVLSTALDAYGSSVYVAGSSTDLQPRTSVAFLPNNYVPQLPTSSFLAGALVSASRPIRAMVTVTNRQVGSWGIPGGIASGQYQATMISAAAYDLLFPIVKYNWGSKSTTFYVQNLGTGETDLTVHYQCGSTPYTAYVLGVGPGQARIIMPSDTVPPNTQCSAHVISSYEPIAGASLEHFHIETPGATLLQASRGFSPSDASTTIYAPVFKREYDPNPNDGIPARGTGVQVMNISGAEIDITATYYGATTSNGQQAGNCAPGWSYEETAHNIPSNGYYTFQYPPVYSNCLAGAKFVGTGNIVAVVNEAYADQTPSLQSASAYNAFPSSAATRTILAPLYKEKWGGKTSGIQVQNVDTTIASVHLLFRTGSESWQTLNFYIQPGGAILFYKVSEQTSLPNIWLGTPMPANKNVAVTVYSTKKVVAVINEDPYPDCYGQQAGVCYDRQNYEGFNVAP